MRIMRFGRFGSVIYSNLTSNRSKCSLFWQKYKSQEAIWNPDEPALNDLAPGKRVWELLFLFQGNWFCCRWKHKTRHFSCTQRFVQITVRATRNVVLALYVSAKPRICWKWHFNSALCQRWAKGRVRVRKWSCFVTTDSGLGKRPDVLIKMSSFVCMKAAAKYHNHQWNNRTFDGWDGRWMVVSKWSQLVSNVRFRLTQEAGDDLKRLSFLTTVTTPASSILLLLKHIMDSCHLSVWKNLWEDVNVIHYTHEKKIKDRERCLGLRWLICEMYPMAADEAAPTQLSSCVVPGISHIPTPIESKKTTISSLCFVFQLFP